MLRSLLALGLALTLTQSLSAQNHSRETIKTGTYNLQILYGGGTLDGTLVLTQNGDSLKAKLKLGDHDSPVRAGERKGNKLALESDTPGMAVHYDLEFKGDQVTGSFTFNGEPGTVTGKLQS